MEPATADLSGSTSIAGQALKECFDPDRYVICLAHAVRSDGVPMDAQRERLAALARVGTGAARASADELARHHLLLSALFERFAHDAVKAAASTRPGSAEAADKLLNAAIKAQRAAVATLSALKVLRDEARPVNIGAEPPMLDSASTSHPENRTDDGPQA